MSMDKLNAAITEGDEVSAQWIAKEIIARNPNAEQPRIRLAQFLLDGEAPDEALAWVDGPWVQSHAQALCLRASAFFKLGRLDEAEREISRSVSIAGKSIKDRNQLPHSLVVAIDVARQRGDRERALDRARSRHDFALESPPLMKREMEILVDLGRVNDARELVQKIFETQPELFNVGLGLAWYLIARDLLDDAIRIADLACRCAPKSQDAWRLRARVAQVDDDPAKLRHCISELIDLAPQTEATARLIASVRRDSDPLGAIEFLEKWCANNDPTTGIECELIAARIAAGQIAPAHELLRTALGRSSEDSQLLFLQARLASEQGRVEKSDRLAEKVLALDPGLIAAWRLRIDLATGQNDYKKARVLIAQAKEECDGHIGLIQAEAQILVEQGRHFSAIDLLTSSWAGSPAKVALGLTLGQVLQQTGNSARASAAYLDVLAQNPDNRQALHRLSEMPLTDGDRTRFAEHVNARMKFWAERLGTDRPNDIFAVRPALIFAHADLLIVGERREAAAEILKAISVDSTLTADLTLWFLFLCERCQLPETALPVIERLIASTQLTARAFGFMLRHLEQLGAKTPTLETINALLARVQPSQRGTARADAYLSCLMPDLALRSLRNAGDIPNQRRVTALARALVACGRTQLAYRYLRKNHRHLPVNETVLQHLVTAALVAGQHRDAEKLFKAMETSYFGLARNLRARVLGGMGELEAARALIDDIETGGGAFSHPLEHLRILIGLGDYDAAANVMRRAQAAPGSGAKQSAHHRLTDFGAKLQELRLYSKKYDGTPEALDVSTLSTFAPAAERYIADRLREGPVTTTGAPVPRRIIQYWDKPDPPEEIRGLMRSWRTEPDVDYILYDSAQAQTYLAEHFDIEHMQAFRQADNAAEESDFFRLCALYAEGGVYADADDRLIANWSRLVGDRGGMTVFREPHGAIANNILIAPPGHPALARAIDMAREALLRSDSDIAWSKTGPGLLTRAIAITLAEDGPDVGLSIHSEGVVQRLVSIHTPLPYKKTSAHWKQATQETNSHIRLILDKVMEWSRDTAPRSEETGLKGEDDPMTSDHELAFPVSVLQNQP